MAKTAAARITKDSLRSAVGKNLKSAREAFDPNMTQAHVAELFNPPLTRAAVAQWEIGETLPDLDRLAVLSKAFGITIDSLIFGDDPNQRELSPEARAVARLWTQLSARQRALHLQLMRATLDELKTR